MSITLDIPNDIFTALHLSPAEAEQRMKLELAISLYAQNLLSQGKAAELAGVDWFAFNDVLAKRGIPLPYGRKELEEDLAYARSSQ
jgi:predicted HTH domain antitoxin